MTEKTTFSKTLAGQIKDLLARYPSPDAALLPVLHVVQAECGWFSDAVISATSEAIGQTPEKILGVVSFYTMFHRQPVGRYHIMACRTLSCALRESAPLLACLKENYGLKNGSLTDDGLFSLEEAECLAACDRGPVVQINGELHSHMTPEKLLQLLSELAKRKGGEN